MNIYIDKEKKVMIVSPEGATGKETKDALKVQLEKHFPYKVLVVDRINSIEIF